VNGFNRFIMLIIALVALVVPVLLLLVAFGVLSAQQLGFGNITSALQAIPGVDLTSETARWIVGIVSALVLLLALFLIFRELTFGKPVARKVRIQDEPGKETVMTATAVKHLAEAAAREVGAVNPTAKLATDRGRYNVSCDIEAPVGANVAELATRVRENIAQVFDDQRVPNDDVEVTVRGVADPDGGGSRGAAGGDTAGVQGDAEDARQGATVR